MNECAANINDDIISGRHDAAPILKSPAIFPMVSASCCAYPAYYSSKVILCILIPSTRIPCKSACLCVGWGMGELQLGDKYRGINKSY